MCDRCKINTPLIDNPFKRPLFIPISFFTETHHPSSQGPQWLAGFHGIIVYTFASQHSSPLLILNLVRISYRAYFFMFGAFCFTFMGLSYSCAVPIECHSFSLQYGASQNGHSAIILTQNKWMLGRLHVSCCFHPPRLC